MGYTTNTRNPRRRQKFSKKVKSSKKKVAKPTVKKMIAAALNRNIETKTSVVSNTDGVQIQHNNFININSSVLYTSQGTYDPETTQTQNRVGDKINLRGVSMKLMLELNERYSDVTFRIMVIKSARGDTPTRATMFMGQSGNKMLDTFNHERYTIIGQKWVKLTAPNRGSDSTNIGPVNPGVVAGIDATALLSRATRIVKMWIPGKKFARNGVIQYENGGGQQKFFDYNAVVYAYSNYSTDQDIYNVGRVNDSIFQMYYKDG